MSEEIKPCPFCGDKDIELFPNYGRYFAACCVCGSEGPSKERKEEAIKAWNQRPYDYDMPAIVKKVQRMEAALKIFANPENWDDKGHSMGFAEFPFVAGDPIEIAMQALGESCKQPE